MKLKWVIEDFTSKLVKSVKLKNVGIDALFHLSFILLKTDPRKF